MDIGEEERVIIVEPDWEPAEPSSEPVTPVEPEPAQR
jgi:hypothetical protein